MRRMRKGSGSPTIQSAPAQPAADSLAPLMRGTLRSVSREAQTSVRFVIHGLSSESRLTGSLWRFFLRREGLRPIVPLHIVEVQNPAYCSPQ